MAARHYVLCSVFPVGADLHCIAPRPVLSLRHWHWLDSPDERQGQVPLPGCTLLGLDPAEGVGGTMKRVVQVAALTGLMTLAAASIGGAPAGAATPKVVHTKINLSLTNIDQCGFTVNSVVQGTSTMQTFVDASGNVTIHQEAHVVSTLTNVANGKVVHVSGAGRDAFTPNGVVNPDGTTTFTDTLTGMPVRVYTSHSSTLLKDSGFMSIVTTVDAQGNLLSQQVTEHGPHPFAGDFTVFCNAITSAIG